jgi:hypothetical protein
LQEPNLFISPVRYIDYQRDRLPGRDLIHQIIHKRIGFVHEREVRVVYWSRKNFRVVAPNESPPDTDHSILVPWDIQGALDHIIVSPFAPHWYPDVVAAVLHAFSPTLEAKLVTSELGEEPIF